MYSLHVPLFWHGMLAHSSMSENQIKSKHEYDTFIICTCSIHSE